MNRRPSIAQIIDAVCGVVGIDYAELINTRRRPRPVSDARAIVAKLAHDRTLCSYPEIGRALRVPCHSTIVEASQRAERLISTDARFARLFDDCARRLHEPDPWKRLTNDQAMTQDPQRFRAEVAAEAFNEARSPR